MFLDLEEHAPDKDQPLARLGLLLRLGVCLLLRWIVLVRLLEQRILLQLLGQDAFELEPGHLQQLDRLLQRRGHHQLLRELQ